MFYDFSNLNCKTVFKTDTLKIWHTWSMTGKVILANIQDILIIRKTAD